MSTPTKSPRRVGDAKELAEGSVYAYYLSDLKRRVAVARLNGRLYAFDDLCTCTTPEDACPLSSGLLAGTKLMCQCHGSRFDITDGSLANGPATQSLRCYEVSETDGGIHVSI